jgi:hypothetical protein
MSTRKFRWSKDYESAEEELTAQLKLRKIDATREIKGPDIIIEASPAGPHTRLWCAEGSFVVKVEGRQISMQPGDGLDVENADFEIHSGITGCIYYQA